MNYMVEQHSKELMKKYQDIGNKNVNQQKLEPKMSLKRNQNDLNKTGWLKKQIKGCQSLRIKETMNMKGNTEISRKSYQKEN